MALPDIQAWPYSAVELSELYQSGGVLESKDSAGIGVNISAQKSSAKGQISSLINDIQTSLSGSTNPTAWNDALEQLKNDQGNVIESTIPDSVSGSKQETLLSVADDYTTYINEDSTPLLTYPCPQCQTNGLYPTRDANGDLTGEMEHCPTCDGYGYTENLKIVDPASLRYIDAP